MFDDFHYYYYILSLDQTFFQHKLKIDSVVACSFRYTRNYLIELSKTLRVCTKMTWEAKFVNLFVWLVQNNLN